MDMPAPQEWKLKTTEDGAPVIEGTKITFVDPEGKEIALDPPQMYGKIVSLNKESKGFRDKAEAATAVVTLFEGVEDIPEWKKKADDALKTVENFNSKDWMDAKKVEKLKTEMATSYDQKLEKQKTSFTEALNGKDAVIASKDSQIHKLLVTNNFAVHPLFGGPKPKTKLSPEMAEAYFAKHYRVEVGDDGVELMLRAYNDPGKFEDPIYSRENPGEPATFAEAMNELWDRFPGKDALMGASPPGSGSGGGSGDGDGTPDELASLEKAHAKAVSEGRAKDAITLKNQIFRFKQQNKL
jgi:hypothetical protein